MLKLFLRRTSTKDHKPTVTKPAAAGELAQGELWLNNNHETPGLFARADDDTLIEFPSDRFLQDGANAKPRTITSKLKDTVSVMDFGAVGDGVADDTAAIKAAIAASNALYFPPRKYRLTDTINLRGKAVCAEGATLAGDHAGIVALMGGNQAAKHNPIQRVGAVERVSADYSITPAVRIIGAKCQQVWVRFCPYVQLYADADDATGTSCAYSSFWFDYVAKLELDTKPAPAAPGPQWINENTFYLGRTTSLRVAGSYSHNHNTFVGGGFESGSIDFQVGSWNTVRGIRCEGGCPVNFALGTADNTVVYSWSSSGRHYSFTSSVTDPGGKNLVTHQRNIDQPWRVITGFTYQNLRRYSTASYNVSGVKNVTVDAASISVEANKTFYDSGFLPCPAGAIAFTSSLLGVISASGYRLRVTGYDANKNAITGASGDWDAWGSTPGLKYGQTAPAVAAGSLAEISGWTNNTSAAFVRIEAVASAARLEAEGFTLAVSPSGSGGDDVNRFNVDSYSGANTGGGTATLSKVVSLSDNVKSTVFTFKIPALTKTGDNVTMGFEVSYAISTTRSSSVRSWQATYGKVYGVISRGFETAANAAPVFQIVTTDQALVSVVSGGSHPVLTWNAALDAGSDSAAKQGRLELTVDNTLAATNVTSVTAAITWVDSGLSVDIS